MANRNSYDTAASGEVQSSINSLAGQIQSLIATHRQNVQAALSDASASGVTENYRAVEDRFNKAADSTLAIIQSLKETLAQNDATAAATLKKAQSAVDGMG
jgi:flagellar biosynthesis/type III secretory pathway chaperone